MPRYDSVFCCLLVSRTPISTLFPYTTLFRSQRSSHLLGDGRAGVHRGAGRHAGGQWLPPPLRLPDPDRKSTRLNSSHRCISYAVFCLKKKITKLNSPISTKQLARVLYTSEQL